MPDTPLHHLYQSPAFGRLGLLDYDAADDTLQCHVCGKRFRNLAQHARIAHSLNADEYREWFSLNRSTRLMSPGMRDRLREVTAPTIAKLRAEGKLRNWAEDADRFARDKAAAVETIRQGLREEAREKRRASWTEERRQQRAQERRERNLAGLDRASGERISAGLKRHYAEHPLSEEERQRLREQGKRLVIDGRHARQTCCPECGQAFTAMSHREKYCPNCRPVVARRYQREYKRRRRQSQEGL